VLTLPILNLMSLLKKTKHIGIGNQIILEATQVRLTVVVLVIFAGTVIFYNWDQQNIESKEELIAYALTSLLTTYFVRQFLSGRSMTVWIAVLDYDEDDTNIAMRWAVFLVSVAYFLLLPLII
jgi:hypothetical protein